MASRVAKCACGRVEVTVEGEPVQVYACHCDFCQRRSGSVFIASASFVEEQVTSITGETSCYNGLEVDGVGAPGIPGGINFRFCTVCGSSMYLDLIYPPTGQRVFAIALGCFADPSFPPPTSELNTKFRPPWLPAIPGAHQVPDALEDEGESSWREADVADGRADA